MLVVSGTRVQPRDGRIPWVSPQEAPEGLRVLLGEHDGRAWFAVITGPEVAQAAKDEWFPLRGLLPHLADQDLTGAPLVFHALGLAEWLFVTRFCPRCGGHLEPRRRGPRAGVRRLRPVAVPAHRPGGDHGRRLRRARAARTSAACSAARRSGRRAATRRWPGFCEPGETLEDAVRREVLEETGVVVGDVEYFGNQPWPLPASLMLGFIGRAVSEDINVDNDEIEDARWFTRAEMKAEAEAGTLVLPGGVSISRSLVEHWYGGPLPGQW